MDDAEDAAGLRLVSLGFVAVIAIAGLIVMLTQSEVTGKVSGLQKLGTQGIVERTPYEACRAVHTGSESGLVFIWSGVVDPRNELALCIDPMDPDDPDKAHWAELKLKYG
jgi:hypothetical protein